MKQELNQKVYVLLLTPWGWSMVHGTINSLVTIEQPSGVYRQFTIDSKPGQMFDEEDGFDEEERDKAIEEMKRRNNE